MIFKSHATIAANPDITMRAHIDTLDVEFAGEAGLDIVTGEIELHVTEIPLHLTIPFLRRRRVVAGTLGPFRVKVNPAQLSVRTTGVHVEGAIGGENGIDGTVHCQGKCQAEIDLVGQSPGKILKAAIEGVFEE